MPNSLTLRSCLSLVAVALLGQSVHAQTITYDLLYSGTGGSSATGQVTVDWSITTTSPDTDGLVPLLGSGISGLTLTVSGAGTGNGTFTDSDFRDVYFWGSSLIPTQDLVSQSGFYGFTLSGLDPSAPDAAGYYTLLVGDDGQILTLTSFAPLAAVPEPSQYAMMAGVGLFGFGVWRKRASK